MIPHTKHIGKVFCAALLLLGLNDSATAADNCSTLKPTVDKYRTDINANSYSNIMNSITFPFKYILAGREMSIGGELQYTSSVKFIFNKELKDVLNASDTCKLAKIFGVSAPGGKITSLVYDLDPADTIYSSYGISSARKLYAFLDNIKKLSDSKDYDSLSSLYKYPFKINIAGSQVSVASKSDFVKYGPNIVNDQFKALISNLITTKQFDGDYNGLMLNETGDYWILPDFDGNLLLRANNPSFTPDQ